jgi:hypothetical protein
MRTQNERVERGITDDDVLEPVQASETSNQMRTTKLDVDHALKEDNREGSEHVTVW